MACVISNYWLGPCVTKDDCRDAMKHVCNELSQAESQHDDVAEHHILERMYDFPPRQHRLITDGIIGIVIMVTIIITIIITTPLSPSPS